MMEVGYFFGVDDTVDVILLAGGKGTRCGGSLPKQYCSLGGKPVACYSLELFHAMPETRRMVVVCDPVYRHYFSAYEDSVIFALPGLRRQDSLASGLRLLGADAKLVAVHDVVRPFVTEELVRRVARAASECGAAAPGLPVRGTVKRLCSEGFVEETVAREHYWEMQTPQITSAAILREGLDSAERRGLTVTDDVALVELMGRPVKIAEGLAENLKITVPQDLLLAQGILETTVV